MPTSRRKPKTILERFNTAYHKLIGRELMAYFRIARVIALDAALLVAWFHINIYIHDAAEKARIAGVSELAVSIVKAVSPWAIMAIIMFKITRDLMTASMGPVVTALNYPRTIRRLRNRRLPKLRATYQLHSPSKAA